MKNRQKRAQRIAFVGISASLALLLSYVEFLLPPIFVAVPGMKMGLPNVIILYVLYALDVRYAALVSFVRICLSSMLFGNTMTFAYSVVGALLSLLGMLLLKRLDRLSTVGVSVAGGVLHNLGQVLVAMVLLDTPQLAYYMIVLSVTGILSGVVIGLCSAALIKRVPFDRSFHGRGA